MWRTCLGSAPEETKLPCDLGVIPLLPQPEEGHMSCPIGTISTRENPAELELDRGGEFSNDVALRFIESVDVPAKLLEASFECTTGEQQPIIPSVPQTP
jgi:hypothetical protein